MEALDPHKRMNSADSVTIRHTSPMPHVDGILPPSVLYLHLPSEFARKSLLYAVYVANYFCDKRYSFIRDSHDYYVCAIVDSGTLFVIVEGKEIAIAERSAIILPGKKPMSLYAKGKMSFRFLSFDGLLAADLCGFIFSTKGNTAIEKYNYLVVDNAFNRILALAADGSQNEFRISAQIHTILGELLSHDPELSNNSHQAVARAIDYMEKHFRDDLSVKEIAAAAYYSEHYFTQLFKESTNLSPHAYLRKLRVAFAENLLSSTDITIEAMAENCGFNNPQSFIRSFRRQCGCAPGQYRKKARASTHIV
jgi:AraC-like DNA-binding protein